MSNPEKFEPELYPKDIKKTEEKSEEEIAKELPWDVEKEISKEDWQGMKEEISLIHREEKKGDSLSMAAEMKFINPDVDIGIELEPYKKIQKKLERLKKSGDWEEFLSQAVRAKIMYPKDEMIRIKPEDYWDIRLLMMFQKEHLDWKNLVSTESKMEIIIPHIDVYSEGLTKIINDEDWLKIRKKLEFERDSLCRTRNIWDRFLEMAADTMIINPGIDLGLNEKDWKKLRKRLERLRKEGNWQEFAKEAKCMKIISEGGMVLWS